MLFRTKKTEIFRSVLHEGGPYSWIMFVDYLNPVTVFIYGLHGEISRKDYQEALSVLYEEGIRYILRQRHGKIEICGLDFDKRTGKCRVLPHRSVS